MRIALVCRDEPPLRSTDAGECSLLLAREMAAHGHEVTLIVGNVGSRRPALSIEGRLRVCRVNLPAGETRPARGAMDFSVEAARVVWGLGRRGAVDVVEFAEIGGAGGAWMVADSAAATGVPAVVSLHLAAGMAVSDACGGFAGAVIAPTARRAGAFRGAGGDGAEASVVRPPVTRRRLRVAVGGPRLVAVVRPGAPRELEMVAGAWLGGGGERAGWSLTVVEAPSESPRSESALRLAVERVLPVGVGGAAGVGVAVAHDMAGVEGLIGGARACAVVSSPGAFCSIAAAAAAMGCPVVASDLCGVGEAVGEGSRFAFRDGDAGGFVGALRGVFAAREDELGAMGRAARERIRRVCDPAAAVAARVAVYERAIEARRSGSKGRAESRLRAWRSLQAAIGGGAVGTVRTEVNA